MSHAHSRIPVAVQLVRGAGGRDAGAVVVLLVVVVAVRIGLVIQPPAAPEFLLNRFAAGVKDASGNGRRSGRVALSPQCCLACAGEDYKCNRGGVDF